MGRITFTLDNDVEEQFRRIVALKYGARKGAIGSALNEAVRLWIAKAKEDLKALEIQKE